MKVFHLKFKTTLDETMRMCIKKIGWKYSAFCFTLYLFIRFSRVLCQMYEHIGLSLLALRHYVIYVFFVSVLFLFSFHRSTLCFCAESYVKIALNMVCVCKKINSTFNMYVFINLSVIFHFAIK